MFPNLLDATTTYWRKLDQLEAQYHRGEISLDEVDQRVAELMAELGEARRLSILFVWQSIQRMWSEQRDTVVALGLIALLAYGWALTHFALV